jgi:hypothetical protein
MSTTSELSHLFRALKAPAAARALPKLANRARAEDWSYERFAQALLSTEHASREAHGGEGASTPQQRPVPVLPDEIADVPEGCILAVEELHAPVEPGAPERPLRLALHVPRRDPHGRGRGCQTRAMRAANRNR